MLLCSLVFVVFVVVAVVAVVVVVVVVGLEKPKSHRPTAFQLVGVAFGFGCFWNAVGVVAVWPIWRA